MSVLCEISRLRRHVGYKGGAVVSILAVGLCATASAQTVGFDVLHRFNEPYNWTFDKQDVGGVAVGADGAYYGVFGNGGPSGAGAVFRLSNTGGGYELSIVHNFDGTDGVQPVGRLVLASDGNLYGVTNTGTTNGTVRGTIFRLGLDSSGSYTTFTTIHSFSVPDGLGPTAGLIKGTDGNLYGLNAGSTSCNGQGCFGTVYRVTLTGTLTVLHTFTSSVDSPVGPLLQTPDGALYGVTGGQLFKIDSSGSFSTVHTFTSADGSQPNGGLIQASDGLLYGTFYRDSTTGNCGRVVKVDPATGILTVVFQFPGSPSLGCTSGAGVSAGVVQGTDGRLYGVTDGRFGGVFGTVYALTLGGSLSTLHTFNGTDGGKPMAALFQTASGDFIGTTSTGGSAPNADGTVFAISPSGTFTTLFGFQSYGDGYRPFAGLIQAPDGSFYGTTELGGSSGKGTVFKFDEVGGLQTLHDFSSSGGHPDGSDPAGRLLLASDGNLYGTTQGGGTNNEGTVFRVGFDGTFDTLYSFSVTRTTGWAPGSGLIQASDGNLYGTTNSAVFKIDPIASVFSVVHSFTTAEGGPLHFADLIQGQDGRLYGTAATSGGAYPNGMVYAVDPATGELSVVYAFIGGSDGSLQGAGGPSGELVANSRGHVIWDGARRWV